MTEKIQAIVQSDMIGVHTYMSPWSDLASDLMEEMPGAGGAPSGVAATSQLGSILITWNRPTVYADNTDLPLGAIAGYWVYCKQGSAPTTSDYVSRAWCDAEVYVHPVSDTETYYFIITAVLTNETESAASSDVNANGTVYTGTTPPGSNSEYIGIDYIGYYDATVGDWVNYMASNGDVFFGGAAGKLQWDYSETTLIVEATYKSASSGTRIEIWGIGADAGKFYAKDASNYIRIKIEDDDLTMRNASNSIIAYIPTTTGSTRATNPYFSHNQITVDNKLVIGTTGIDNPSQDLYVDGAARLGDDSTAVSLVVGDHGSAATDEVCNICYGTGSPPTANTTTEGALFVKYST